MTRIISYWCLFVFVWLQLMTPVSLLHLSLAWAVPLLVAVTVQEIVSWDRPHDNK